MRTLPVQKAAISLFMLLAAVTTAQLAAADAAPDLVAGAVVLAPDRPELRCSSNDTTCGDRPAWPMQVRTEVQNRGSAPSPAVKVILRVTPGKSYTVDVPPLHPGSVYPVNIEHTFATLGHTEVRAEIDPEHRIPAPRGYQNLSNILQMEIRPPKPDLVVDSYRADNRYVLQTAKFSFTVTNRGAVNSGYPCKLRAEFVDSRAGTKTFDIPALRPGEKYTVNASHKYRAKGKKKIRLTIDAERKIAEIDEKNNQALMEFRIVYP